MSDRLIVLLETIREATETRHTTHFKEDAWDAMKEIFDSTEEVISEYNTLLAKLAPGHQNCQYNSHGHCQTHTWERPCPHEQAKKLAAFLSG